MTAEPMRGELMPQEEPRQSRDVVQTPMQMLGLAIDRGMDVEALDKLMGLAERFEANKGRRAFDEAIAQAKAEIAPVVRNKEGHNQKRYADFAAISRAVDPVLSKFGLSYRFRTSQTDRINVTCILSHKDGHSEETTLAGPPDASGNKNAIQAIGSTLTYLQRYSLVQALGLAAADDDDGRTGDPSNVVTDAQADEIRALLDETRANVTVFLEYIGAPSVSDIPAAKFKAAKAALLKKKAAK